jgi:anti-sigma-K factor RskA
MMHAHDDAMLELAALRAIDALDAGEAAIIDAHMAECAECRAEFARSRSAATALAFDATSPAPAALRGRVLASAVKIRRIRPWYRRATWQAAIAAAVILIVAGSWFEVHRAAPQGQWAAHCTSAGSPDCGLVVASGGVLRLDAHGLAPAPAGKVYQAWIIPPKQQPIPEPTFSVSSDGSGSVQIIAAPQQGDVVAVTLEPVGGSKAPTTKPVLVATLD